MDKALRYLGLAARAGRLAVGAEDCGKQLRKRRGGLLIAAADAASNTLEQAHVLCSRSGTPMLSAAYTKQQLGLAAGRAAPVALALICDEGLAEAFAAAAGMDRKQEDRV